MLWKAAVTVRGSVWVGGGRLRDVVKARRWEGVRRGGRFAAESAILRIFVEWLGFCDSRDCIVQAERF